MKTTVKSIVMVMFITFIAMGVQAQTANSAETKVKRTAILGADPLGIALKDAVKEALVEEGFEVTDITGSEQQDYFDVGYNVGRAVSEKKYDFGFVFCGTGMGVNLVANKFNGVHCALCESIETARLSRVINNANVLSMGGIVVTPYLGKQMARAFVRAQFSKDFTEANPDFLRSAFKRVSEMGSEITRYNYDNLQK